MHNASSDADDHVFTIRTKCLWNVLKLGKFKNTHTHTPIKELLSNSELAYRYRNTDLLAPELPGVLVYTIVLGSQLADNPCHLPGVLLLGEEDRHLYCLSRLLPLVQAQAREWLARANGKAHLGPDPRIQPVH